MADQQCLYMQHKATHMTIICSKCKNTKVLTCKPGLGGAQFPRYCDANAEAELGAENCGQDPFVVLPHKSRFSDLQTLKLQVRCFRPLTPDTAGICRRCNDQGP